MSSSFSSISQNLFSPLRYYNNICQSHYKCNHSERYKVHTQCTPHEKKVPISMDFFFASIQRICDYHSNSFEQTEKFLRENLGQTKRSNEKKMNFLDEFIYILIKLINQCNFVVEDSYRKIVAHQKLKFLCRSLPVFALSPSFWRMINTHLLSIFFNFY